jgi:hypothetical protein
MGWNRNDRALRQSTCITVISGISGAIALLGLHRWADLVGWPTPSRWLDPPPFELVFFVPGLSSQQAGEGALLFAESAVLVFALAAKGGMR